MLFMVNLQTRHRFPRELYEHNVIERRAERKFYRRRIMERRKAEGR